MVYLPTFATKIYQMYHTWILWVIAHHCFPKGSCCAWFFSGSTTKNTIIFPNIFSSHAWFPRLWIYESYMHHPTGQACAGHAPHQPGIAYFFQMLSGCWLNQPTFPNWESFPQWFRKKEKTHHPRHPKSFKYLVSRCLEPLKAFSGDVWRFKHLLTRCLDV